MTTLPAYLDSVAEGIHGLAPSLKDVAVSRGRLRLEELERRMIRAPAARVGLLRIRDLERMGNQVAMTARVSVVMVFEELRTAAHDQAHGLVSGLAVLILGRSFGMTYSEGAVNPDFQNLFSGAFDKRGLLVWELTFDQRIHLSIDVLEEGTVPADLFVGYAPDIGAEHRDDYRHIGTGEPPPPEGS